MNYKHFIKRAFVLILLGLVLVTALPSDAFAADYDYSLVLPYPLAGSMRSEGPKTKQSHTSPYVNPSIATTPTNYFLSPQSRSDIKATGIIRGITTTGRRNFSYESGYGGHGSTIYFSAYPDTTEYNIYQVRGKWSP